MATTTTAEGLRLVGTEKLWTVPRPTPARVPSPRAVHDHIDALQILMLADPPTARLIFRLTERLARSLVECARERRDA